jgi:hypothetical protein
VILTDIDYSTLERDSQQANGAVFPFMIRVYNSFCVACKVRPAFYDPKLRIILRDPEQRAQP